MPTCHPRAAAVLATIASIFLTGAFTGTASGQSDQPDDAMLAGLQAIVDRLPDLPAASDTEQTRSLLGPPDAFTIAFEPRDDGSIERREQWFYYDLSTVFEFVDGAVIWDLPLDAEEPFLIHPRRYDPADFTSGATWDSLASVVGDPGAFESMELQAEYGLPATVRVGDLLTLVFDEDDGLFYVEAVPLSAEETP